MNYIVATIRPWNLEQYQRYFGRKKNFHLITKPENLTFKKLQKLKPRYIFFPHWSWIIPTEVWQNFECVVFHMTDLPYGRGGSPLQNLIVRGLKKTKVSALRVADGIDNGDIYFKQSLDLTGSAQEIYERLAKLIFNKMIPKMITQKPQPRTQKGEPIIFKRRTPPEGALPLGADLEQLYDHIRMLDAPEYPKAFLDFQKFKAVFDEAKFDRKQKSLTARVTFYEKQK